MEKCSGQVAKIMEGEWTIQFTINLDNTFILSGSKFTLKNTDGKKLTYHIYLSILEDIYKNEFEVSHACLFDAAQEWQE